MDSMSVRQPARWLTLGAALLAAVPALALETATLPPPAPEAQGPAIHVVTPPAGSVVDLSDARRDAINLLELEFGRSATVRAGETIKRVSVGNSSSLDVVVLGSREVQLVPKSTGSTNVVFWGNGSKLLGTLDVAIGAPHSALERQLRKSLGVDTISVEGSGSAILLTGTVPDALSQENALSIARAYLALSDDGKGEESGGRDGEKANEASGARVVNLLGVGGDHQVMLKVVIAEMNRNTNRAFGTNFAAVVDNGNINLFNTIGGLSSVDSGQLLADQAVDLALTLSGFGNLDFLSVLFEALDEKGIAKVLAEPTLVARSGETASFLVGGEVPIPVAQQGTVGFGTITVEYKDFGVGLKFTPTVLAGDRIHLDVRPEVSEPDDITGVDLGNINLPVFRTRRAATAVELADGQSLAIAGLLLEDVSSTTSQYPLLGSIPIIGTLFRRTTFVKEETELMIVVTPRLVKPMGEGPHALPTDGYVEPSLFDLWLLGRLEGKPNKSTGGMVGDVGHRVSDSSYWSQN